MLIKLSWQLNIQYICYVKTLIHLLLLEFDIPELWLQLIHLSLKYQGVERPNLQGVSCRRRFECGMTRWPSLHCLWYQNSEWVQACWLLPWVMFYFVFCVTGACGVAKATYKQLFSHLGPVQLVLIIIIIIVSRPVMFTCLFQY